VLEDIERYRPGVTRQLAALEAALGDRMPRRGWKVAINVPEVLRSLDLHHPCLAWLDGPRRYRSGDVVSVRSGQRLHAEPELCLVLGGGITSDMSADEALARVAAVAPAIELVDYALPATDLDAVVAGSAFHAGFAIGAPQPPGLANELAPGLPTLVVPGRESPAARRDLVPLHLGELVRFAAGFLDAFGWCLEDGDLLLSGSFAATAVPLAPGSSATADFGALGSVGVQVSARL